MAMQYLVIVEKADTNYGAYAPDVPGCIATGDTIEETLANYREALRMHLEAMARDHEELPRAYSVRAVTVDVDIPVPA
jgi:predicted RNase H-like HicB family nuclease